MVHAQLRQVSQSEGSLVLDQPYRPCLLLLRESACIYLQGALRSFCGAAFGDSHYDQ